MECSFFNFITKRNSSGSALFSLDEILQISFRRCIPIHAILTFRWCFPGCSFDVVLFRIWTVPFLFYEIFLFFVNIFAVRSMDRVSRLILLLILISFLLNSYFILVESSYKIFLFDSLLNPNKSDVPDFYSTTAGDVERILIAAIIGTAPQI